MEKRNWFNKTFKEVEKELETDLEKGLSKEKAEERQEKYGFNELQQIAKKSIIQRFLEQFKDFSIIVLIIAAIVSGIVGVLQGEGITDTIIILIVVIVNAIIGVAQESKAEKSLEALQKLSDHASKVIRNENMEVVPSKELVPGDIVVLDTGDYIPADLRIIEAVNLKTQESSLTGESVPVEKTSEIIEEQEIGIGDRKNMLFSSSLVTYGRGKGIVVETGMTTEVGKIAGMINSTEKQETPLQQKLDKLGKTLGIAALVICAVIFILGILQGKEIISMFMTAVSLAVAAIPEGLVAVSTIVLAIGVQKMVKKNAIVKRLPAVETLGSATVICSDKTGTLTQNKMTVEKIFWNDATREASNISDDEIDEELTKLVYANMLCNDTKISSDGTLTGDPTETALVDMGFKLNFDPSIYDRMERVEEIPFDSDRKLMTTVNKVGDKYVVYTKGGIDEILKRCNSYEIGGQISEELESYINKIRQEKEKSIYEEAIKQIEEKQLFNKNAIIVGGENWHHGVIGIVSSKITDLYFKPSILLCYEDNLAKGSGRSIPGFDLHDALMKCQDSIERFGGHAMAIGITIKKENFEKFSEEVEKIAEDAKINEIIPIINIDAKIDLNEISKEMVQSLKQLEPFGEGNKTPIFAFKNLKIDSIRSLTEGKHIKMTLKDGNTIIDAIGFNLGCLADEYRIGDKIDVVGNLEINSFNGVDSLQINLKDVMKSI